MRVRQGAEEFSYEVHVLSIDGRLINLGTYKTNNEKLKLEFFRTHVSDVAPAKFDIRLNL
jgi:hypothetical protein